MSASPVASASSVALAAVLFDLDGTVLDTHDLILASFRQATHEVLGAIPPEDMMMDMVGMPLADQMALISPEHAEELVQAYRAHNARIHDEMVRAFPQTEETLAKLLDEGLRLAIVTSKRNELAVRGLSVFGLERFFEFLIGSDDTKEHKPHPAPLCLAADRLGLDASRCAYVGDSPYDMQAARAAHMPAVAALWGMFTQQRLREAGAEYEVSSFADLPAVLANL